MIKHTMQSQVAVLTWLQANHPALNAKAELERDWVWIADVDLSGDANKAIRDSLLAFGFKFKSGSDHRLPSGRGSRWSHACIKPIPRIFKRRGASAGNYTRRTTSGEVVVRNAEPSMSSDDAAELLGAL